MAQPLPIEVDVDTVAARLRSGGNFLLLDCREQDEHALVHIDGALLLPMSELLARAGELAPYRDHEIAVHCHLGGRSLRVANWLRAQGYAKAQSMAGGIDAWSQSVDPSLRRY